MTKESPESWTCNNVLSCFQTLILAEKLGIRCIGFGSVTKWYFTLNALIREFIAT